MAHRTSSGRPEPDSPPIVTDGQRSDLVAYREKRDPERTPEPFGGRRPSGRRLFVVQKHAARRLHYDFRLEIDGVLKSWAVPKGPSAHPGEKRLAVHVEDHPIEYGDFEGVIPAGNYGAGAVIVWDRGWYRPVKDGDLLEQLAAGKLEVELFGAKLRGRFTLARMSGKERDWLLLKKADAAAGGEELTDRYPESVISGLTVEEMRDRPAREAAVRAHLAALAAPPGDLAARDQPFMLASLGEKPFSGRDWLFEIKYDGVRIFAERRGHDVELRGRSGQIVTTRYPEVVAGLRALPASRFLLDGEIVAFDPEGRPSFQRLQARMGLADPRDVERAAAEVAVTAVFFDCLSVEGVDLRGLPLVERKRCLAMIMPPLGSVRYGDHVAGDGLAFFEAASERRLEGIVAKKASSAYAPGRSRDWIKLKCHLRQEFVVGGYTDPQGSRGYFGALHLGVYDQGRLVYVSKVGTGFDRAGLTQLWDALAPLARSSSPFAVGTPVGRGHHWVEPRLVAEVRFTDWTRDGGIRHPTFLGLRTDKRPEECRREEPETMPEVGGVAASLADGAAGAERTAGSDGTPGVEAAADAEHAGDASGTADAAAAGAAQRVVKLSNLNKVFWPAERYTKGDLVAYYDAVAPVLLPYLRDRPVVLTRYPDGIGGKSFFQKDAPEFVPSWVRTERIYSKDADRDIDYFVVNDAETLRYIANMASIPLHLWSARIGALDRPDWLVLDLDPKGAPFTDVVRVAQVLHRILDDFELPSYVKTSGATGLHIHVPLGARYSHEDCRNFARLLAVLGVQALPEISTVARPIHSRGGKVYIDFGQNGHGRTVVAPYSVRPLPGAPVACPLRWDEVTAQLDPAAFTIRTGPPRFAAIEDPLTPILGAGIDLAAALARIERRLGRDA